MVEEGKQSNTAEVVACAAGYEPGDEVVVTVAVVQAVTVGAEVGPMERHNCYMTSDLELQNKFVKYVAALDRPEK